MLFTTSIHVDLYIDGLHTCLLTEATGGPDDASGPDEKADPVLEHRPAVAPVR